MLISNSSTFTVLLVKKGRLLASCEACYLGYVLANVTLEYLAIDNLWPNYQQKSVLLVGKVIILQKFFGDFRDKATSKKCCACLGIPQGVIF